MLDPSTAALPQRRTRKTRRTRKKRRSLKIKARTARSQTTKRIGLGGIFWSDGLLPTKLRTCHIFSPLIQLKEGHVTWKTKTLQRVKHYPKRSVFFVPLLELSTTEVTNFWSVLEMWMMGVKKKTRDFLTDASTGKFFKQPVFALKNHGGWGVQASILATNTRCSTRCCNMIMFDKHRCKKLPSVWTNKNHSPEVSPVWQTSQVSPWKKAFQVFIQHKCSTRGHQLLKGHIFTKGFQRYFLQGCCCHGRPSQKVKMKLIVPCWQVSISKSARCFPGRDAGWSPSGGL